MRRILSTLAIAAFVLLAAPARGLESLDDETLANVSGRDGIAFAVSLRLNDPNNSMPVTDNRLVTGFNVGGQQQYLVVRNLRGSMDMFAVLIDVAHKPDGGDYLAVTLPGYLRFGHFGFESMSAQTDPRGPITGNLGRFEIDGMLSMRGQVRMWAD